MTNHNPSWCSLKLLYFLNPYLLFYYLNKNAIVLKFNNKNVNNDLRDILKATKFRINIYSI